MDDETTNILSTSNERRNCWIVTTAALPWRTGTSINPLLRALFLIKRFDEDREKGILNVPSGVHLMIPWLVDAHDRRYLYSEENSFCDGVEGKRRQTEFIRDWSVRYAKMPRSLVYEKLKIWYYPAKYHSSLGSIFPLISICSLIPDEDADICILEEPEHLNWIPTSTLDEDVVKRMSPDKQRSSKCWNEKFGLVVGIAHTNYSAYTKGHGDILVSPALQALSSAVVRAYCDKVILLSSTLETFGHSCEIVKNIHGVRSDFFQICSNEDRGPVKAYFVGKLLWSGKGFDKLYEYQHAFRKATGKFFDIDVYGSGSDENYIRQMFLIEKRSENSSNLDSIDEMSYSLLVESLMSSSTSLREFLRDEEILLLDLGESKRSDPQTSIIKNLTEKSLDLGSKTVQAIIKFGKSAIFGNQHTLIETNGEKIPARFLGVKDHSFLTGYSIFVNTSTTEVLCTTTAEALAMGKWVIIPQHRSNLFFEQFDNCLSYNDVNSFINNMEVALRSDPKPMRKDMIDILTWEAATQRLIDATELYDVSEKIKRKNTGFKWGHQEASKLLNHGLLKNFFWTAPESIFNEYKDYY